MRRRWNRRTGKELIGWGRHREQDRANETDAGQVWRKSVKGKAGWGHRRKNTERTKNPETKSSLQYITHIYGNIRSQHSSS